MKKWVALGIGLLGILLIVMSSHAQEKVINWDDSKNVKDSLLPNLIENRADISGGRAVFEFYCPFDSCLIGKFLSLDFALIRGHPVKSYSLMMESERNVSIPDYDYILKECSFLNGTKYDCSEFKPKKPKIITEKYWKEITPLTTVPKGTYRVKIEASWAPAPVTSIDWIPKIDIKKADYPTLPKDVSVIKTEWAWWNTSWTKCKPVTVNITSGSISNLTAMINVTYDSDMQADFDDIRFINSNSCTTSGNLLGQYLINKTDSVTANFEVLIPFVNATIAMYYGYAGASLYSNRRESNLFYDNFSEAAINSTLWYRNMTSGAASIVDSTLYIVSGSSADSGERYCSNGLFPTPLTLEFDWATQVTTDPVRTSEIAFFFQGSSLAWYYSVVAIYENSGWKATVYNGNISADSAYSNDTWYHEMIYGTSTLVNVFTNVTGSMVTKSSGATGLNAPSPICPQAFYPSGWQQERIKYDNFRAYTYTAAAYSYSFGAEESSGSSPPSLAWNTPATNNTYTQNVTWIYTNVTISEAPDTCLLNVNGTANYTMSKSGVYCYYNLTGLVNNTIQRFIVYANISTGESNRTIGERWVTVNLTEDHTPPYINISSPNSTAVYTNPSIWLNFSIGETPSSVWYKLNGGSNTSLSSPLCYQETANASTSCGGLGTGSYTFTNWNSASYPPPNGYDGNWSSYTYPANAPSHGWLYINYTKPANVISTGNLWEYKIGSISEASTTRANYTIASDCWGFYSDTLSFAAYSNSTDFNITLYCYNGGWKFIANYGTSGSRFYEDAMWWNVWGNRTITAVNGTNTVWVYANDSAGNLGYDSVTFTVSVPSPIINISSPIDGYTYYNDSLPLWLNFTIYGNTSALSSIWYNINGSSNVTITGNVTISILLGTNPLTLYANDSYGNLGYSQVSFIYAENATTQRVTIYVYDIYARPMDNITMEVEKYYANYSIYASVGSTVTDVNGVASFEFEMYETWYRFIFKRGSTVIYTYGPMLIVTDPIYFTINEYTSGEWFDYYGRTAYSCIVANASNYTACTVTDSSSLMLSSRLEVLRRELNNTWTTVCDSSSNASTVTHVCAMGTLTGNLFWYSLTATYSTATYGLESGLLDYTVNSRELGQLGVLIALMLIITMAFVGAYKPGIAMILTLISTALCFMFGIIDIGIGSIIAFGVVVAVAVVRVGKG